MSSAEQQRRRDPQARPPGVASGYIPELDGIRAIAALLVLLFHAHILAVGGDLGVDVFFVLSGFLITGILLRDGADGRLDYRRFYARRALRLLPAYVAVLMLAVASDLFWDAGGTLKGGFFSFFYVSNWANGQGVGLGLLGHTWSLSIEEQFYLVWPLVLMLMIRWTGGRSIGLVLAIAGLIGVCVLLVLVCRGLGFSSLFVWNATFSRGAQILGGALLAACMRLRWEGRTVLSGASAKLPGLVAVASLAGLLTLALMTWDSEWTVIFIRWPLVVAFSGLLIACCSSTRQHATGRLLASPPLVAVGRVSYGIYLWHFPVLVLMDNALGLETWRPRLLAIGITAALVPVSYRWIERPFLVRKRNSASARGLAATA